MTPNHSDMKKKHFIIENDKGEHFAVVHLRTDESEERFTERVLKAVHKYADDILEMGLRARPDTVVLHTTETGDIRFEFRWVGRAERETFWLVPTVMF